MRYEVKLKWSPTEAKWFLVEAETEEAAAQEALAKSGHPEAQVMRVKQVES